MVKDDEDELNIPEGKIVKKDERSRSALTNQAAKRTNAERMPRDTGVEMTSALPLTAFSKMTRHDRAARQGRPFLYIGPFIGPIIWFVGPFIGSNHWFVGPFVGPFVH